MILNHYRPAAKLVLVSCVCNSFVCQSFFNFIAFNRFLCELDISFSWDHLIMVKAAFSILLTTS